MFTDPGRDPARELVWAVQRVAASDIYDPTVNPLYRDVLAHKGIIKFPRRVGNPNRK